MKEVSEHKLAVLIDADNIPSKYVREMLEEITKYGTPTTKRIYGDWTKPTLAGWKSILLESAITPIQQYSYTTGKNSTDSAMIIDAMDLLYTGKVDGFCIVSSDSDFTRLAIRLRESGMIVIGLGEKKTPIPFIAACNKFIYIEILKPAEVSEAAPETASDRQKQRPKIEGEVLKLITSTINDIADEDGWAYLGDIGNQIIKKRPDFDPRNYGFFKLTPLVKSLRDILEVDERVTERGNIKLVYVRVKKVEEQKRRSRPPRKKK
jgi:uncharacterized LabA/DUF88 family protein